tara:strand:- start:191 stop:1249 length:1059 start_codon:yes stop_codon:yes gene_type:complete
MFDTLMCHQSAIKENLTILTTPIHHTSFRNIIEKYVKPENVYILKMNDKYNEIIDIPNYDVDLCIITHLFGQDMNLDKITDNLSDFSADTIFIEDRVQGGTFDKKFSKNFIDISLYSTGMDKKPCGLGGGIAYIKNNNVVDSLYLTANVMKCNIKTYKQEYFWNRLVFLLKKIPTYILYNCKPFIKILIFIFSEFKLDLHEFASKYRKNNPGFQHSNYNMNPSNGTLESINYAIKDSNYKEIERLYRKKSNLFFNCLTEKTKKSMFKWYRGNELLTPYNSIFVKDRVKLIHYFNSMNIPVIENPTYKIFNFEHQSKTTYKKFNDSIVYLPSLAILTTKEINLLACMLNNYID